MACINADGTLTSIAGKVLIAIKIPATVLEINQRTEIPLYRIRSSVRELHDLELLEEKNGVFQITDKGKAMLAKSE
jgi:predicted transcriptional regulator